MAKQSRRGSPDRGPLRRRVGVLAPRRTFLVFCEGARTEPEYLRALKREPAVRDAASVEIQIDEETTGSAPLTLVRAAAKARARAGDEFDEVWCLFDVEWPENHSHLREALDLARDKGIKVAVSNPCFELWLALHFDDQTAFLDNSAATRLRRRHDGRADKGLDGALYMARRADAARRARALTKKHQGDGTKFPHNNPSSGMHQFLDAIESPELAGNA